MAYAKNRHAHLGQSRLTATDKDKATFIPRLSYQKNKYDTLNHSILMRSNGVLESDKTHGLYLAVGK